MTYIDSEADLRSAQPAAGGRNGVTPIREEGGTCRKHPMRGNCRSSGAPSGRRAHSQRRKRLHARHDGGAQIVVLQVKQVAVLGIRSNLSSSPSSHRVPVIQIVARPVPIAMCVPGRTGPSRDGTRNPGEADDSLDRFGTLTEGVSRRASKSPTAVRVRRELLAQYDAYRSVLLMCTQAGSFEDIGIHGNGQLHGARCHDSKLPPARCLTSSRFRT